MRSVLRFRIALATLLAFLFAGVANVHAHVHLCLDGLEPPAAMHVDDPHGIDHHVDHHVDAVDSHQDADVDVPAQVVAKTLKFELPVLGPLASWHRFVPVVADTGVIAEIEHFFLPLPLLTGVPPCAGRRADLPAP